MRLLLAEDEVELSNAIVTILKHQNYSVDAVYDGLDAYDYLTKPFAMQELLARVRAITRRNGEVQGQTLSYSDLTLNRSNFTLTCGDKSIALSNKEFQMLEMMITNPKQIISQDQFMDKIWGLDSETEMSVVWVYISYLRKKLKDINSHVSIKATRNVGYSLIE